MAKYSIGDIFKGDYPISQYFGNNPSYYAQFGFNGHEGVDFATPVGIEVLAPFKRNVILQDQDDPKSGAYGDYIVVWDPDQKIVVWYCHLSVNNVELGKEYPYGTVLGKTGNTGNSTGPHLHINFAETDDNRNRLNTGNGFKGFLNILDKNLVEWKLGQQTATPVEDQQTLIDQLRKDRDNNWNLYAPFKDAGYDTVDKVKAALKQKDDIIDNLNTQISKIQNEHSTKDTQISSLQSQVLTITQEVEGLRTKANELEELKKYYSQLESDAQAYKLRSQEAETRYLQKIKSLEGTSYKTAPNSVLFQQLTKNMLHIS
jgi:hypothetical protein